ncbi:putative amidohydrolase [Salirhabdus euzebyi]|uniref:Putative amidohydrolase n=1 Tax=Salirhabdus euzebyi TaxID=394506 RepID=A0A841Q2Y7_9BACI|nr:carbon-nitrogen family hydrolase [Salirhabdus euzebyi]MBB6451948.1 putative amidohydrolase [Salirhabdus euzebyi]
MTLKVALIQMNISFGNPEANYEKVRTKCKEASEKNVDVIVLPELWTTGYDLTRLDEIADVNGEKSYSFIAELAKDYNVSIVGGSIPKETDKGITNTLFVVNRKGEFVSEYSKAHLFRLMDEEKYLTEGNDEGSFILENIKSAGVICYDIRFPEWIRTHMLDQTKVLYVVAEWPKPRIDHWRALLISRAIENQCFVVACNRVGTDPKNEFGGHSLIVGPWGEVIVEAEDKETILYGEFNPEEVDKVRETIPIFTDRRPDLYKL